MAEDSRNTNAGIDTDKGKQEMNVDIYADQYLIVSSRVNGEDFYGILLKRDKNNASEEGYEALKNLARSQGGAAVPSTGSSPPDFDASRDNGLVRLDPEKLSSLCYRQTYNFNQSMDLNPFKHFQSDRAAKGIRRLEYRPVRLRPVAGQRSTVLCARCQKQSVAVKQPPSSVAGVGTARQKSPKNGNGNGSQNSDDSTASSTVPQQQKMVVNNGKNNKRPFVDILGKAPNRNTGGGHHKKVPGGAGGGHSSVFDRLFADKQQRHHQYSINTMLSLSNSSKSDSRHVTPAAAAKRTRLADSPSLLASADDFLSSANENRSSADHAGLTKSQSSESTTLSSSSAVATEAAPVLKIPKLRISFGGGSECKMTTVISGQPVAVETEGVADSSLAPPRKHSTSTNRSAAASSTRRDSADYATNQNAAAAVLHKRTSDPISGGLAAADQSDSLGIDRRTPPPPPIGGTSEAASSSSSTNQNCPFKAGDSVWAKMRSYPYWPAKVFDIQDNTACVTWCGSSQYGYVDVSVLEPFLSNFNKRYNAKRNASYQKAVADALNECGTAIANNAYFISILAPTCRKFLTQKNRLQHKKEKKRKQDSTLTNRTTCTLKNSNNNRLERLKNFREKNANEIAEISSRNSRRDDAKNSQETSVVPRKKQDDQKTTVDHRQKGADLMTNLKSPPSKRMKFIEPKKEIIDRADNIEVEVERMKSVTPKRTKLIEPKLEKDSDRNQTGHKQSLHEIDMFRQKKSRDQQQSSSSSSRDFLSHQSRDHQSNRPFTSSSSSSHDVKESRDFHQKLQHAQNSYHLLHSINKPNERGAAPPGGGNAQHNKAAAVAPSGGGNIHKTAAPSISSANANATASSNKSTFSTATTTSSKPICEPIKQKLKKEMLSEYTNCPAVKVIPLEFNVAPRPQHHQILQGQSQPPQPVNAAQAPAAPPRFQLHQHHQRFQLHQHHQPLHQQPIGIVVDLRQQAPPTPTPLKPILKNAQAYRQQNEPPPQQPIGKRESSIAPPPAAIFQPMAAQAPPTRQHQQHPIVRRAEQPIALKQQPIAIKRGSPPSTPREQEELTNKKIRDEHDQDHQYDSDSSCDSTRLVIDEETSSSSMVVVDQSHKSFVNALDQSAEKRSSGDSTTTGPPPSAHIPTNQRRSCVTPPTLAARCTTTAAGQPPLARNLSAPPTFFDYCQPPTNGDRVGAGAVILPTPPTTCCLRPLVPQPSSISLTPNTFNKLLMTTASPTASPTNQITASSTVPANQTILSVVPPSSYSLRPLAPALTPLLLTPPLCSPTSSSSSNGGGFDQSETTTTTTLIQKPTTPLLIGQPIHIAPPIAADNNVRQQHHQHFHQSQSQQQSRSAPLWGQHYSNTKLQQQSSTIAIGQKSSTGSAVERHAHLIKGRHPVPGDVDFDSVLSELREMNELCENSSSPTTPASR